MVPVSLGSEAGLTRGFRVWVKAQNEFDIPVSVFPDSTYRWDEPIMAPGTSNRTRGSGERKIDSLETGRSGGEKLQKVWVLVRGFPEQSQLRFNKFMLKTR
jgi:hypothetical protein